MTAKRSVSGIPAAFSLHPIDTYIDTYAGLLFPIIVSLLSGLSTREKG